MSNSDSRTYRRKNNQQTDESIIMSQHYARGVYRRLAEQNHDQTRHYDLREYDRGPTIEEVVEDMVEHGFEEATARASAQTLWDDELYDHAS